jgi:hypothetical protein
MQTTLSITAAEPDVYMGLGSAAYALARISGKIHAEEVEAIRRLFVYEAYGDLAFRSFLIQEYHDESEETAYAFAMRRITASRHVLDEELKDHLVMLLSHIAGLNPDSAREKRELLQRFQRDLQKL